MEFSTKSFPASGIDFFRVAFSGSLPERALAQFCVAKGDSLSKGFAHGEPRRLVAGATSEGLAEDGVIFELGEALALEGNRDKTLSA